MKKKSNKNEFLAEKVDLIADTAIVKTTQETDDTISFPVVGIGASAGGLETLEVLFNNLPHDTGMAYVIILHLDPTYKGMMPEILQRYTKMRVQQAKDGMTVEQNNVYVIPPNCSLSIFKGMLHLFEYSERREQRMPVDFFFRSLANDLQDHSVGIILSGMDSDGSLGLRAIKEQGGLIIVQEPKTAKYEGMPRSAIDAVQPDIVAAPADIPAKLVKTIKQPSGIRPPEDIEMGTKNDLYKILILLQKKTGNDFSQYKKNTLYRRIERRMGIHGINKISDYVRFLQENQMETDILFKEMLIGVTRFFRDMEVWDYLMEDAIPEFLSSLPNGYTIRAWVPATSTGEEAYSLAIAFREALIKINGKKRISIQIFATDIDADAIEKARKGIFQANISTDVPPALLKKYFTHLDNSYKINSDIREMVVFAVQNAIKDAPFTRIDYVSCRNLMIYLESELQKKLLFLIHYALNSNGMLVLGTAESLGSMSMYYMPLSNRLRIYRKAAGSDKTGMLEIPDSFNVGSNFNIDHHHNNQDKFPDNIQTYTESLVLEHFAPPTVLVNTNGDIIYITGRIGKFLEPSAGKAVMNIFAMAREGLRYELATAFRKAMIQNEPVKLNSIIVNENNNPVIADVIVQQIKKPAALKDMLIVVFYEVPKVSGKKTDKAKRNKEFETMTLKEMELEIIRLKEELQNTREAMQSSEEELKSNNEELQSTNEELQSTNEELTTSKEEMQSLNEELQTVNSELQSKVDDYARINNDMNNLFNSNEIATLFLDRELLIHRFTPQTKKIFKLIDNDIGRPLTDLATSLEYPDLFDDARNVLRTLVFSEKSISTHDERWYNVKITPYRTTDERIEGLVMTFNDITKEKKLEAKLNNAIEELKAHNIYDKQK